MMPKRKIGAIIVNFVTVYTVLQSIFSKVLLRIYYKIKII